MSNQNMSTYVAITLFVTKVLGSFNYHVGLFARNIAGGLLAAMLVMILMQVFFRYVMNDSLTWTEELSKYAMVWVACLVSPWAYRENLNVSIELFADALPLLLKRLTEILITLLVMFISAMFFIYSVDFWLSGLTITASSVPVKLAVFYSCIPFMFVGLFLVGLERLLLQILPLKAVKPGAV
jgi:TRAP-type C4-dicarboxylate transport system permease small subunit